MEVETHLQIAHDLGYIEKSALDHLLVSSNEIGRMLDGLMESLNKRLTTDH